MQLGRRELLRKRVNVRQTSRIVIQEAQSEMAATSSRQTSANWGSAQDQPRFNALHELFKNYSCSSLLRSDTWISHTHKWHILLEHLGNLQEKKNIRRRVTHTFSTQGRRSQIGAAWTETEDRQEANADARNTYTDRQNSTHNPGERERVRERKRTQTKTLATAHARSRNPVITQICQQ